MTFSPDEDDDSMQNINSPGDSSGFLGKGDTKQVVDRIFLLKNQLAALIGENFIIFMKVQVQVLSLLLKGL